MLTIDLSPQNYLQIFVLHKNAVTHLRDISLRSMMKHLFPYIETII